MSASREPYNTCLTGIRHTLEMAAKNKKESTCDKAVCKICKKELTYCSTTTKLWAHLQSKHPEVSLSTSRTQSKQRLDIYSEWKEFSTGFGKCELLGVSTVANNLSFSQTAASFFTAPFWSMCWPIASALDWLMIYFRSCHQVNVYLFF